MFCTFDVVPDWPLIGGVQGSAMASTGKSLGSFLAFAFIGFASLAPAAPQQLPPERIIFEHAPDNSAPWPTLDVYSVNADGSLLKALTHDGHSHNPTWSPDGRQIVYVHDNFVPGGPRGSGAYASHHPVELYEMDSDGEHARLFRRFTGAIFSAAWSPDGKTLAVAYNFDTYLIPVNGHGKPHLLYPNALTPAWSPDGRKLAFSVRLPGNHWGIDVGNSDGTHQLQITDPSLDAGSPEWSPDGEQIAFAGSRVVQTGTRTSREDQIFLMRTDGSHVRQLTTDPDWQCAAPSWAPDGKELAFYCRASWAPCAAGSSGGSAQSRFGCVRRIFVMRLNGLGMPTKPVQITKIDGAFPAFEAVP